MNGVSSIRPSSGMAAAVLLSLIIILSPLSAQGADTVEISDESGDVLWKGYRTQQVEGFREIDIISLTSEASVQDVTIELTMDDDVSDEVGYIYSISASGINVAYREGEFQVWKWDDDIIAVDNVQTGVNGDKITCIVPRKMFTSDLVLNATAQYYIPSGHETGSENYFDSAGEFGPGTRVSIIDLTRDYDDPDGDVEMSYYDERTEDDPSVDILSISADLDGDLSLSLSMDEDIVDDGTIVYTILCAGLELRYTGGQSAWSIEDGELEDEIEDVTIDDDLLQMRVPEGLISSSLGPVVGHVRKEASDGSHIMDMVPNDPYSYNDLLPFPPGDTESLEILVQGPGGITLRRVYGGFSERQGEDIRSTIDTDDDQAVSQEELDSFFSPILDGTLEEGLSVDIKVNDRPGTMDISLSTKGLIGPVLSSEELIITWTMEFVFETGGKDRHKVTLDVQSDPFRGSTIDESMDRKGSLKLLIEVNRTWRFEPLTLEPSIISNYMDIEARTIEMDMDPEETSRFDIDDIGFEIYRRNIETDDDDEAEGGGSQAGDIWIYITILVLMVIVLAILYTWSKSREMD